MKKLSFYVVYFFLQLIALLPFGAIYRLSDFAYFIIYRIAGYRKKVVFSNLRHAFPEKSPIEIQIIAKDFYRHFTDTLFESVKILNISKAEINRRFVFKNPDIFEKYFQAGKSIVLVSGHQGNWEWMIDIQSKISHKFLAIYKPLLDENFNNLLKKLREKYADGGELVAMNDVYKSLLRHKRQQVLTASWFLVDQSPLSDYPFWIDFMNRETPFFTGPAKISKKLGFPVLFMQIRKLKRGFYEADFSVLANNPASYSEEEIVEKYVRKIEDGIREQPAFWLWSHRRWKHQKKNSHTSG